jgi:glucose-6-phosphate 1-dehydrogenase
MNPSPTILVLFGATGDLVTRKIGPTLSRLDAQGKLPEQFVVLGFSRRDYTDETFRATFPEPNQRFFHERGELSDPNDYHALRERIEALEASWGAPASVLFYLALSPRLHQLVLAGLETSGLAGPKKSGVSVLVEKPFGEDLASAQKLDDRLRALFSEEHIFRVDHYLAKEMLQNILAFRFANQLFEPTWNDEAIERIDVRFFESLGVGSRGATYDMLGTLRDAGQNHLLQMLAAVTMEQPSSISPQAIRQTRAELLSHLEVFDADGASERTTRAQARGFRTLDGVDPTSETETFFSVRTTLNHPRWRKTEIVLTAGKDLPETQKDILITFRHPTPCLCAPGDHVQNRIRITLDPEERIGIEFWALKSGGTWVLEPRNFDFLYRKPGETPMDGYERLLLDALLGDQTVFASREEIEASWRFVDALRAAWDHKHAPLTFYEPGTWPASNNE